MKVETRVKEIMTKSTFGLNGNLKYPETTLKIRKMCGYFANPLENDMEFSPQTSSDFAHAQTLFSSVTPVSLLDYAFRLAYFSLRLAYFSLRLAYYAFRAYYALRFACLRLALHICKGSMLYS